MIDQESRRQVHLKVYTSVLLLGIAGSYVATEVTNWVGPEKLSRPVRVLAFVACLILLYLGVRLVGSAAAQFLRFRTRRLNKSKAEPRRVLVWFLSHLSKKKRTDDGKVEQDGLPVQLSLQWNLEQDLARLAADKRDRAKTGKSPAFWNWEQPLRGIHHGYKDGGPLERLILICSHESIRQVYLFSGILRRYPELQDLQIEVLLRDNRGVRLLAAEGELLGEHFGWNFEDFDDMWDAVSKLLEVLEVEQKTQDRDIAIDLTGGQKPATVVAATVTINRDIRNQYVCTNPKDSEADPWQYEVLDYDLILGSPRTAW